MELDLDNPSWDRTFLDLSSKCAEPFCYAFRYLRFRMAAPLDGTKFENRQSLIQEIALRSLLGVGTLFALYTAFPFILGASLLLGAGTKLLRAAGYFCQKNGFTHVRGSAPEKSLDPASPELKVLSWNHCGVGGGMSQDHGGVIDWRYRIDAIAASIKKENPDVLVLQEYYDTAFTEALITKLGDTYAHFFIHLGQNLMGSESGVIVLSKYAVHDFSYSAFQNNDWKLNRGFATLEIKATPQDGKACCRIIGTHLIHGDRADDRAKRMAQISQIVDDLSARKETIPTLLAGDSNIERNGEEGLVLTPYLTHGYLGNEPTCTNRLVAQWDREAKGTWAEMIDIVSLFKEQSGLPVREARVKECHLVKAFDDTYNTKTALSDHHGISAVITLAG